VRKIVRGIAEIVRSSRDKVKLGMAFGAPGNTLSSMDPLSTFTLTPCRYACLVSLFYNQIMELAKKEEQAVNKVAKDLLETLKKEKLVLDWRKRQQTRAAVRLCIEEILDRLPPTYTKELYQEKCDLTYRHVYDSYFGMGQRIHAAAP
jgi:hypothetical protein